MSLLAQDEKLATRVGAAVLLLVAAAIAFFVFVAGRIEWGERVRVHAFFKHTGELREGAPVIVGGRTIGSVESIGLSPRGAKTPLGGIEGVDVTIKLSAEHAATIVRGGDVFIAGRGALSARHLEIGPAPNPDGATLADNQEPFRGIDPPTMDRVIQRTWDNLMIAKRFADEVAPEFRLLRDRMRELSATLEGLVPNVVGVASLGIEMDGLFDQVTKLRAALGGDRGLEQIAATLGHARATVAQARRVLDTLDAKATTLASSVDALRARLGNRGPAVVASVEAAIAKLRAAMDKIDPLLAKLDDLNARIARGEGTIGKLARDPEFPEDAKDLGKILKRQPWRIFMRPKD
jgi:phospholipid/cholesterol/gamma-HCH transport system substrate-binding protein